MSDERARFAEAMKHIITVIVTFFTIIIIAIIITVIIIISNIVVIPLGFSAFEFQRMLARKPMDAYFVRKLRWWMTPDLNKADICLAVANMLQKARAKIS